MLSKFCFYIPHNIPVVGFFNFSQVGYGMEDQEPY